MRRHAAVRSPPAFGRPGQVRRLREPAGIGGLMAHRPGCSPEQLVLASLRQGQRLNEIAALRERAARA
jgi:hypothetical protein